MCTAYCRGRVHKQPGGLQESSRGSEQSGDPRYDDRKRMLHPGGVPDRPCALREGISDGTQRLRFVSERFLAVLAPLRGARLLCDVDRGSPLRAEPRLLSGNPPGCSKLSQETSIDVSWSNLN